MLCLKLVLSNLGGFNKKVGTRWLLLGCDNALVELLEGEAVADGNNGGVLHSFKDHLVKRFLGGLVYGGCCFVKEQVIRLIEHGSGYAQTLLLRLLKA